MNNESFKSPQISTTVSNTSANNNCSNTNTSCSTNTATSFPSIPSSISLSSSAIQSFSTSAQLDVTVNAIAAVVNATNKFAVSTPPNAAAVVAVAVSSLAAAIIPDTPIVSIAGSTLSEITTTTTSTKTTPTPVPTSKETGVNKNNNAFNLNSNKKSNKHSQNKTSPSSDHPSSPSSPPPKQSVKDLGPMSVANLSITGDLTNASTTGANTAASENDNINSFKIKEKCSGDASCETADTKTASFAAESKSIPAKTLSSQPTVAKSIVSATKTDDINITPNKSKSKDFISESWEESRLKDWDDSKLKELLDEAYSYKNPRDKENKSKTFLQLLEKAENEDQSYPFCVTSRGSRNLSNSITSNNYHHYQQNSHYHSNSHNNNRSHQHKQGGSLQDLFEIGLHESQLDCDPSFGIGVSGNQRTRRQNHNSRQKKYSSSVSSRQREGGSLPSNVNVVNDLSLMQQQEVAAGISGTGTTTNTSKTNKKEQRRNASKVSTTSTVVSVEAKENNSINSVGEVVSATKNTTATTNSTYTASGGDVIIDMGEPMMDIQQQQKILQCKGQDAETQGHPFYERLDNIDKRIARSNLLGNPRGPSGMPTTSHCYVDEAVRFNALERNGNASNDPTSSTVDAKFLPLDENYKSCKSVLGNDGDKSPELLGKSKPNTIYTNISSPASGSAISAGTPSNIATLTQRQLDENGNALNEIYQNTSSAGTGAGPTIHINSVMPSVANASGALLNSCGNVSTSATVTISPHTVPSSVSTSATVTTTFSSGPSQAKAKTKKKSQQERNTKTVDVQSVAGYRGEDTVEELVKYIESSGEDKQTGTGSGSKSSDKKKERKKDKEKHQKLKKSNSLEELRSGAKMEVHELKRTAATTESNAVLVRQKSGASGKQNKNNSSSTADINKNLAQTSNSRKSDRRSWGNEDLKYLEDQQNANLINEDKSNATANSTKERKHKIGSGGSVAGGIVITNSSKEEKDIKDKTTERNERNLVNIDASTTLHIEKLDKSDKYEKSEKSERFEKLEKSEKLDKIEKIENKLDKTEKRKKQDIPANAVTVVDILAMESVLPETAEFHVVTKKKKPKKQKVINNLEETTVTFNRTHNFTMQKTSTFNQQQQQMTVRYKYYHHDNASNTGISNANTNSQNYQQPSSQQHQQSNSFNSSNAVGASNAHHHNLQQNQLQHHNQQQQHHQQQHSSTENYTNINDKSRRKSTSSVPPSEKSDSSDLDSVHSLPIESSKANVPNTTLNTVKGVNQQRSTKALKNNSVQLGNNNNSLSASKNHNLAAPISYADIARTNKEIADAAAASASGILINNNEIPTECRNAEAPAHTTDSLINTEEKSVSTNNPTSPPISTTALTPPAKTHKIKKSQMKQDFPELSGTLGATNDDKILNTNANHKTIITYSQSLTTVATNPTQNIISTQCHANIGDGNINFVNDTPTSFTSEVSTKITPLEQYKNPVLHHNVNIAPLQHSQQQVLQKSKSVENDSITTSTIASLSSAATYMAPLNSNNLDQQYPALEKTVKRHSSANVTLIGIATNSSNQISFNFAAAAKQQMNTTNVAEQHVNSALTTSNTTNTNNINQATLLPSSNIIANKKSKEKSPPLTSTSNIALTTEQQITSDSCAFNANATNATTAIITTSLSSIAGNPKKAKKERQHQQLHQHIQLQQSSLESSHSKQHPNQNQNNNSSIISNRKPFKTQLKSSSSSLLGSSGTSIANRPAVIILNDDRNSGSCAADNQFTFGDFNEEELKIFDDDNDISSVVENRMDNNVNIHVDQLNKEKQINENKHQRIFSNSETARKSAAYLNDSGTSCGGNDNVNNTSDMLLSYHISSSSPNSSFVTNSHGNNGSGAGHMTTTRNHNNQFSDSGIYADKMKSSNSSCSSSSSSAGVSVKQKQKQQITTTKMESTKLNNFLSNTKCASVHTSMDNLEPQLPPPQQLETCNDIETAIIAAARAAAKYQQPVHNNQKQHQQYKNSNTSSNSSSFSSSISSTSSAYHHHHHNHQHQLHHQQPQQQHHHQNNKNDQNQYGRVNIMSYHHQYEDAYDNDDNDDDNSFANTPRSRSPSHPRRISIAGGTVASKEFDIHFIPPTTMPTAFSMQQHNDTIIDFIGSAWEEVANSKVTKVYDGQ